MSALTPVACAQPGCGGTILDDGYCDTCGAPRPVAPQKPPSPPLPAGRPSGGNGARAAAPAARSTPPAVAGPPPPTSTPLIGSAATAGSGTRSGSSRRSSSARTKGSTRTRLGAGLVDVPPVPVVDPSAALMSPAQIQAVLGEVPESQRFCPACGRPVGRHSPGRSGRVKGFCGACRTPFDFVTNAPALATGDRVANQYEVMGCLAHGGLGWIYLARDTAVSNRLVVLKGLLSSGDPDALAAAMAERQFLARVEHGNIVRIYNFVTHSAPRGPDAGRPAGYIVMEYVGGESLNGILKQRRAANGGTPDPLPPEQAIAYVLAVLPALSFLHHQALIYNDLKPANIMVTGDDVKLIDLGAVTRADDSDAVIFGTEGFQAPEVAELGVSVASDIYTIGRTLAVLLLNFVYHEGPFRQALPPPDQEPFFVSQESLYRLLLKATAAHPDDRFSSVDELADQLLGVLREVVARKDGQPRPAASALFGADQLGAGLQFVFGPDGGSSPLHHDGPDRRMLPPLRVDPADPAASFLVNLPPAPPVQQARMLETAVHQQQIADTTEVRLRLARAYLDAGMAEAAEATLATVAKADPWEWRAWWLSGLGALDRGDGPTAWTWFDRVWTDLPGELAPKLAAALAAETAGWHGRAAQLYDIVSTVDPAMTSAAFGLARCLTARGDTLGAVAAFRRVPAGSSVYVDAQVAAARLLVGESPSVATPGVAADTAAAGANRAATQSSSSPDLDQLCEAAAIVERLGLDASRRTALAAEVLSAALDALERGALATSGDTKLFGHQVNDAGLRRGLERAYRDLARLAPTAEERVRLVDLANHVRPLTLL